MSIFGNAETTQTTETPQVEKQAVETQESFVKKLVEQRGEKWQDPEVIAKGKIEADTHIENLERQLAEMREDMSKNEYSKKLLEALQNKAGGATQDPVDANNNNKESAATTPNTTEEASDIDLESLVEKTLAKREQEAKVAQNLKSVEQSLESAFGTEARKVVEEKASALGMSLERMQQIASESPAAFMALVGQPAPMERNADLSSAKNTTGFNTSGEKDFEFYQNMRRENPKQYYSPGVQNEMAQARVRLGDKFYRK